jgi:parvulin-like peptidyl-prolyl isomerase
MDRFMNRLLLPAALLGALLPLAAASQETKANKPLVVDGPLVVDTEDFKASLLRIPEERRGDILLSYDRIAGLVDNIFIIRSLAARAREAGLDKDPLVQRRIEQSTEAVLADLYAAKLEKEVVDVNLEQRARELYRADPAKFRVDETVRLHHILVNMQGRTREQALARASMIAEKARAEPEEFLSFAQQYSDDPDKRGNRGDLGFAYPSALSQGIRTAIATMKPGQISDPVETEHGFHVIKFIERKPAEQLKFEQVREGIIRAEKAKLQKQRVDQLVTQIRSSSTVTVHRDNVEALVIPVPPNLGKAPAASAAPASAASAAPASAASAASAAPAPSATPATATTAAQAGPSQPASK